MILIMLTKIYVVNLWQPSQVLNLEETTMGSAGLMDKVYYKEIYFDLLYPIWFKKFILRIVRPVVTWVQTLITNPSVGSLARMMTRGRR